MNIIVQNFCERWEIAVIDKNGVEVLYGQTTYKHKRSAMRAAKRLAAQLRKVKIVEGV
jgi:hypothetical protein